MWAFRGSLGSVASNVSPSEIESYVASSDGWIWLHLDLVDQRSHAWASKLCELPIPARSILEGHDLSLALAHESGVVHGIAADLHADLIHQPTTVGKLHFAIKENVLVTGRRHTLEAVEQVHSALLAGSLRPGTAFELFEAIVGAFCRNTMKRLAEASSSLDKAEDELVAARIEDRGANLKDVRRLAVSLHRPIATLVALFEDDDRNDWSLSEGAHAALKRLTTRLQRLDREIMTVNDRARLLQEEVATELANESNRSLRALALISALLLPGTLIVGVFGMNVGGLPFLDNAFGFLATLLIGFGATCLFYWLLIRAGAKLRF